MVGTHATSHGSAVVNIGVRIACAGSAAGDPCHVGFPGLLWLDRRVGNGNGPESISMGRRQTVNGGAGDGARECCRCLGTGPKRFTLTGLCCPCWCPGASSRIE